MAVDEEEEYLTAPMPLEIKAAVRKLQKVMFKLVNLIVLAAVQLGSFCVAATNPDPLAPGFNFSVALINLQNAAATFTSAPYSSVFPPNIPELEGV
ncbi:hypothetical protein B0H19DRAFT_1275380 [Mycena capillaripes]|nr:hypothetical protein B0H19DRAFT_1275380 [Mycena capillaripes]